MSPTTRSITASDRVDWERLYALYADFYKVAQTDEMRTVVWGWLMDPNCTVEGLVAVNKNGEVVGIAHFRPFNRPLSASIGGFLDDLYVDPVARGSGAAQALIAGVEAFGRARGWTVIRWITAADNARGRAVYDRVAAVTPWVTYDLNCG